MSRLHKPVLVLNASFEPLHIAPARRALTLLCKEVAIVVEHTGEELRPGYMVPRVIRLKTYRHIPVRVQVLSRVNIYARDRNMCQYCGVVFARIGLTLDHIVPRSKGGRNSWENLVTCCQPCNRKKADRTLEECGMTLLHRPRPANVHTSRHVLRTMGAEDPVWRRYLYYES
jgi:5-methylcytosine-specific restriction endonuclease McrA